MKTKEEILFDKFEPADESGKLPPLNSDQILAAMEEYANERILNFVRWNYKNAVGKFECERLIKQFNEEEPF